MQYQGADLKNISLNLGHMENKINHYVKCLMKIGTLTKREK